MTRERNENEDLGVEGKKKMCSLAAVERKDRIPPGTRVGPAFAGRRKIAL